MARLSKVSQWFYVVFLFRRGFGGLSEGMARSGKLGSPKRDGVVQ